jgi:HSP20 family molecular chaperone IbpA
MPKVGDTGTLDMFTEGDNLVVEVGLPNFKKEEVKVTFDNGVLDISAEHTDSKEKQATLLLPRE